MAGIKITGADFKWPFKFENPTKDPNLSGGRNEVYTEFFATRGYFKQLSGSISFQNGLDMRIQVYEMICYWRSELESGINKDTRVIYDNKRMRIERVERMGENRQYYRFELSEAE